MVSAFVGRSGGLELVGVQAIIKDLDKYLFGAQKINAANAGMAKSTQATAAASVKSSTSLIGTFAKVGAGAAIVGTIVGGMAIRAAVDFETAFAGVRKTVDATEEEFKRLEDGIRDMAKEVPVAVTEIAAVAEAAGQLGISTSNILGFTRVMIDLGVSTNLSATEAAQALARLANITGLPQTQFDRLGSSVVALGNNLATTEAEIVEFGLRIAGAGELAGLTEAQILGIGAAFSSAGIEAEAGGTAIQKVLLGMVQAVAEGNEDLKVFAATAGVSAEEFARAFKEDAAGAFVAFVEGLGQAGPKAFQILEQLGLQDQRLIRSFLSVAGAGDLLRRSVDLSSTAFGENNALAEEAARRYETTAAQLQLLKNRINDVAIAVGQALLPPFNEFIGILSKGIDAMGDLAEKLGIGEEAAQAMGLVLGTVVVAGFAAATIAAVNFAIATNAALGGLPLLIGAIVTALVIGTALIIKHWDKIKAATIDVWASIPGIVKDALGFIGRFAKERLEIVLGTIYNFGRVLVKSVSFAMNVLKGDWRAAWNDLKDIAVSIARAMGGLLLATIGGIMSGLVNIVISGLNQIRGPINDLINLANKVSPFGDIGPIGEIGQVDFGKLLGFDLDALIGDVKKQFSGLGETLAEAGDQADETGKQVKGGADENDNYGDSAERAEKLTAALSDGIIDLAEAIELGLSAAQAGALEAQDFLTKEARKSEERLFNLGKAIAAIQTAAAAGSEALSRFVRNMANQALQLSIAASSALFARPTQEQASLQLRIALLDKAIASAARPMDSMREAAQELRPALEEGEESVEKLGRKVEDVARAIQQETNRIFGRPTREEAGIELQIARIDAQIAAARALGGQPSPELERERELLQARLTLMEADNRVQQLRITLADQTLQTENAQNAAAEQLISNLQKGIIPALDETTETIEETQEPLERMTFEASGAADALQEQRDELQRQLQILEADNKVQQARLTVADRSLITEAEQEQKVRELVGLIAEESQLVRILSDQLGIDLIPEMDAAREAHANLEIALDSLTNDAIKAAFTPAVAAAADSTFVLSVNAQAAAESLVTFTSGFTSWLDLAQRARDIVASGASGLGGRDSGSGGGRLPAPRSPRQFQEGGFASRPQLAIVGHGSEVILPLEDQSRSRQLLASLPPGLLASITPRETAGPNLNATFNVSGATVDQMRVFLHREVDRFLNQARAGAGLGGAHLSSGVG